MQRLSKLCANGCDCLKFPVSAMKLEELTGDYRHLLPHPDIEIRIAALPPRSGSSGRSLTRSASLFGALPTLWGLKLQPLEPERMHVARR